MASKDLVICPECGKRMDEKSFIMECEYCLSKKED